MLNVLINLGVAGAVAAGGVGDTLHLELVTDQIERPVFVTAPPGDLDRLFVIDQYDDQAIGRIRIVRDGTVLATPFLELGPVATNNSTGVLCLEFDPGFADNGTFYVFYTGAAGDVVISRFCASGDPDVADPGSEERLLSIPQPHHFHQGGWFGFGPDGLLYISSGDGGPANDPDHRGQDMASLLGKMLRIDPGGDDFPADPDRNYAIPPSNPFVGEPGLDEIWALGLREAWRCSFDRETGDLYIADVGQEGWEEVDIEPAGFGGGANYGWRCREGANPLWDDPECAGQVFTDPVFEYAHAGGNCCVIGGYVYRGVSLPALRGRFLFGDNCSGRIWSVLRDGVGVTDLVEHPIEIIGSPGTPFDQLTTFGQDACGELYVCARFNQVYRIVPDGPAVTCACPWDLEGDGEVDIDDFLGLLALWGTDPGGPPDFDGDGDVGISDFLLLLASWGECP